MFSRSWMLPVLALAACPPPIDPDPIDTDDPDVGVCPRDMPELGDPAARQVTAADPAVAGLATDLDALTAALVPLLDDEDPNGAFSSLSLLGMFSVLLPGAEPATAEALLDVLQVSQSEAELHEALSGLLHELEDDERGWGFEWGAGFWHRPSLEVGEGWHEQVSDLYDVHVEPLDFQADGEAAREVLNAWVEDHTRCLVPEFYGPGYDFSRHVHIAIHAMALEARWASPFDGAFTADRPFLRADGSEVLVPTMEHQGFRGSTGEHEDGLVLRLPYEGDDLAMYIVMPEDPSDPRALFDDLDPDRLAAWFDAPGPEGWVSLQLPKWETTTEHDLIPPLEALGYGPLIQAPLPEICAPSCALPDIIRQVVVVLVDEEGTRAAAVTSGETTDSEPDWTRVDRPFAWFLRDDASGAVLFLGWVGDPSQ